jgi:hypothetical protein
VDRMDFGKNDGRFSEFDAHLQTLSAQERAKILAAEREYAKDHADRLRHEERVFNESMVGYEDRPAGPRAHEFWAFADHNGDWSWKPARDKLLGDKFVTFLGVPPSVAETRPRGAEPGARFYGVGADEPVEVFQAAAIAAHVAAGDLRRDRK